MKRKFLTLILALLIVLGCAMPVFAEEVEETEDAPVFTETVEINNVEEFLEFAKNCTLDSWSQDKQVLLKTDISLAGTDFLPIATFGGSFEGNGHTISGLSVTGSIVPSRLFRYLQPTAVVANLNVQGTVIPSGDAKFVGGVVGNNSGCLENVTFTGTVEGTENVGGIAGMNSGTIRNCRAGGTLMGEKSSGGIAGYNTGLIESCENAMAVNTESVDPTIDPTSIDLEFTMDVENLQGFNTSTAASDTGGIAGYSAGIVMGCTNTGTIGYPHIGYNLGGICGRNCGYVAACHNEGTIYGRKDVGGVVGQFEPDIATILSPDYLEKLSDQFEQLGSLVSSAGSGAAAAGSEFQSYIQTISAYSNQARSALNSIHSGISGAFGGLSSGELPSAPDLSGFSSLASAIQGLVNTTQNMGYAMGESVEDMTGSVGAISGQINSIAKTFELAAEDAHKQSVTDVSDADIAEVRSGKVYGSTNASSVQADLNVGGIVGVMGLEVEADPEDDLSGGGTATQRRQYELKAIVQECVNTGYAESKQNYVGGICGRMELGLITGAENYGNVTSSNGDYVGGIAGIVGGTIRSCFAKCTLSGTDYIGGIAGNGVAEDITGGTSLIADCYSMVEIESGKQYLGAISGGESGTYTGNYFVSDSLGGVNRVSYFALAEPISHEALMKMETLPAGMRKLTLSFVADGETVKTVSFDYGASFDYSAYPEIPEKESHYARWDTTELNDLRFDTIVTAEYFPHITSLNSTDVRANGNPVLFVQGQFQEGDSLSVLPGTTEFAIGEHQQLLEQWSVSIPADGQESHVIRYLPEDDAEIWVLKSGSWSKAETEEMGSYLAFSAAGSEIEFVAVHKEVNWPLILCIAITALLLVLLILAVVRRRRKKTKHMPKRKAEENVVDSKKQSSKKRKRIWVILAVLLLLGGAVTAVVLCYLPQTKAVQTIRAFDILNTYIEQPQQHMELNVTAKFMDRELDVTANMERTSVNEIPVAKISESGRTLYFADGVVFLENGSSFKLNSDAPDYSRILEHLRQMYELVDVDAVDGVYTITAEGEDATQLLELLMPAAKELLSDTNILTVDLLTEADALTEIHFTGAGNLADSVKTPYSVSAVVRVLPVSEIEIPAPVTQALVSQDYDPQEVYSDDLVRLVNAWKDFKTRNPIGAEMTVTADCGPLVLAERFDLYHWKLENTVVHGIEKDDTTIYIADGAILNAEGKTITAGNAAQIDTGKLLDLAYQNFRNAKFQCEQAENGYLYTVTLNQAGIKELMTAVLPEAANMDISYEEGRIQLLIQNEIIQSLTLTCGGSTKVAVAEIAVQVSAEMQFMNGNIHADLPDAVAEVVGAYEE